MFQRFPHFPKVMSLECSAVSNEKFWFNLLSVSNDALRGATPQASSQVLQWVSFADSEIIPPASTWVFPTLGIMQFNKQVWEFSFPA